MVKQRTAGALTFEVTNYVILTLLGLTCLLPFLHMIAESFSNAAAATADSVKFWPVGFNVESYKTVLGTPSFFRAFEISVLRTVIGTVVDMAIIIITAYPLSKDYTEMKGRKFIIWIYIIPLLFSGGLIPTYMTVRAVGLINNFWVLILPGAVQIFSILLMMHFFRGINKSLIEAAEIDGAGHLTILFKIFLPLSLPSLATLGLFAMVDHWNDWFTGLIYLNDSSLWPLQTYLQQLVISVNMATMTPDEAKLLALLSNQSLKSAELLIATIPILLTYPFLQKYFITGLTIGSVKE